MALYLSEVIMLHSTWEIEGPIMIDSCLKTHASYLKKSCDIVLMLLAGERFGRFSGGLTKKFW
jgi:hypothetical protein